MDFHSALQFNTKGYCINEVLPEGHWAKLLQFLFRPEAVTTEIVPVYNDTVPIGASAPYPTYSHTEAQTIAFDLYWNSLMGMKEKGRFEAGSEKSTKAEGGKKQLEKWGDKFEGARRFLEALTVPPEAVAGAIGGTPPSTALLVLPGVCSLRVRLTGLRFEFIDHDQNGNIRELRAAVSWREAPRTRFTMEEVLDGGSFRL